MLEKYFSGWVGIKLGHVLLTFQLKNGWQKINVLMPVVIYPRFLSENGLSQRYHRETFRVNYFLI